jgi:hypothetical protein
MNRPIILWGFASLTLFAGRAGWGQQPVLLFDGTSLQGWHRVDGKQVSDDWEAVDGTLHLKPNPSGGANLFSDREFGNFDLEFEWKICKGGNNGLKYRVHKFGDQYLGCEYQILDDAAFDLKPRGMTGSLYEVYEPNEAKQLKPVGEFNHARIVVRGNHIEHWLNGRLIVSAEAGSPEWFQRVSESKFAPVEGFGLNHLGKIMLTAHGSEVWYRNIVLRPLPPPEPVQRYAAASRVRHHPSWLRPLRNCRLTLRLPARARCR